MEQKCRNSTNSRLILLNGRAAAQSVSARFWETLTFTS